MLDHRIFNERPECQERMLRFLEKLGDEYVSRSEAELKRGKLANVLFTDEIIKFMRGQHYTYMGFKRPFSDESIYRAIKELDVSLLQGLALASREIYNLLTLGISVEEKIVVDKNEPIKKSFDLKYIDFEHPEKNIWQVTDEFSVERSNGQYSCPDIVILCNGIPLVVVECKKSSIDILEGIVLPGAAQEKPQLAEVIAVGPGGSVDGKDIVMQVKVGDKVLYSKYAGSEFKIDGEEVVIVRQADILAVVE